jgi:hypothetical protein
MTREVHDDGDSVSSEGCLARVAEHRKGAALQMPARLRAVSLRPTNRMRRDGVSVQHGNSGRG